MLARHRPETVQTADSQVESHDYAERRRVLRLPRHSEQGGQDAGPGRDTPVREQALPHLVSGRWLPIPRSLLVLPRAGGGDQAVRHRAQTSHR